MEFKILSVTEQLNGGAIVDIEVSTELKRFVRNYYKRKRCTNKLLSRFVNEGVSTYLKDHPLCQS